MKKVLCLIVGLLLISNAHATEINADELKLTATQNQKLTELKENLKAEVEPIFEEIESNRQRITEIEKKYFEEFWNMLTNEQKQKFSELNTN